MAIAKTVKVVENKNPVYVRETTKVPPKPIAVDTKYEPRKNLLTHVSGAKWNVTYYKALHSAETGAEPFNWHSPLPYQQYLKIENFELRVTTPLNSSPDNDNSNHTTTGMAVMFPSVVPNNNDHFIADVGDGRSGFFQITEVTQKSILKDTVYEIEYHLVDWVSHELLAKLNERVVKTEYYERAYADYGANPRLDVEQHGLFKRITQWNRSIVRHYFDSFFSSEYRTFLVPVEGEIVYDPFLVEFIRRIWSEDDCSDLQYLHVYSRDNVNNLFVRTIWDVIISNDIYMLNKVQSHFVKVPSRLFLTGHQSLMGITYSRLQYIYHPGTYTNDLQTLVTIANVGQVDLKEFYGEQATPRMYRLPITKLPGLGFVHPNLRENLPLVDAKKYGSFDTYVLSDAFYNKDKKAMSKVERFVMATLENEPIDAKELLPILEDCINWGEVERFYYIPLLVALSRSALGDLSQ